MLVERRRIARTKTGLIELGMNPPRPADEVWARRAMTMLWEADCEARREHGLQLRHRRAFRVNAQVRKGRSTKAVKPRGRRQGVCAGCGGRYDDLNPGCVNCRVRHAVRRHTARKVA